MTIRCITIDDEPLARRGIKIALAPYPDFCLVNEFSSVDDFVKNIPENFEVLFLDIEMPKKTGFELLENWTGPKPIVVFVTAYNQYAVKAFENSALDYVLKPIGEERFAQVVEKIRDRIGTGSNFSDVKKLLQTIDNLKTKLALRDPEITVKSDEGYLRLKLSDILYIEGIGDHVCFHLNNRQIITRSTLKKYSVELSDESFVQTHKSYLVNTTHVAKIDRLRFGDFSVTLTNGTQIKLSRRFKAAIKKLTT